MKKLLSIILVLSFVLCSCATGSEVSSEDAIDLSSEISKVSSEETSSEEVDLTQYLWKEIDGLKYYDICVAAKITKPVRGDSSALFVEEADGYYIEKGTYFVDDVTMHRILKKPFKGNGSIRWLEYREEDTYNGLYQFDGMLPISRMNDPLYVYTCLPNEQSSYMQTNKNRTNACIMFSPAQGDVNILTIGAIYLNDELDIPDDTKITVCLGRMTCLLKFKGQDEWVVATDAPTPDNPRHLYYLPWDKGLGIEQVPISQYRKVDDHYEITLTAAQLRAKGHSNSRAEASCLHFWGERYYFNNPTEIEGIVSSYEVWVKEPEYSGYLTAAIGADLRDSWENIHQAFSGINYSVTSTPRVVFGHNVAPKVYDKIMDTEKIQEIIGLK